MTTLDIDGECSECGPIIRYDGKDSGTCLVSHRRTHTFFVVNIAERSTLDRPPVRNGGMPGPLGSRTCRRCSGSG